MLPVQILWQLGQGFPFSQGSIAVTLMAALFRAQDPCPAPRLRVGARGKVLGSERGGTRPHHHGLLQTIY